MCCLPNIKQTTGCFVTSANDHLIRGINLQNQGSVTEARAAFVESLRLDPANGAYEPQRYPAERVMVQGKLAGLLRRYH